MIEIASGLICFVTATVSFLYGTRISWLCGRKCSFKEQPEDKRQALYGSLPAAIAVYAFGFIVVFTFLLDGFMTVVVCSLTSAILITSFLISMAMPELRRRPAPSGSTHREPRTETTRNAHVSLTRNNPAPRASQNRIPTPST